MNKFPVDLITFGTCWLHKLPVDQRNIQNQLKKWEHPNTVPEMPVETT